MFRMEGRQRLSLLDQLTRIIKEEIDQDKQLLLLCERDSRLGFHSEAEGYKYFPEKIKWRIDQLNNILVNDVPEIKETILKDQLLFPEYTGSKPEGPVAGCIASDDSIWSGKSPVIPVNLNWQPCSYGSDSTKFRWAAVYSKKELYIIISQKEHPDQNAPASSVAAVEIRIEPQRLYPASHFVFDSVTTRNDVYPAHFIGYPLIYRAGFREINEKGIWYTAVRIPFQIIGLNAGSLHPIRTDVIVKTKDEGSCSWRPDNPTTERLILGSDNPADLGWLIFQN